MKSLMFAALALTGCATTPAADPADQFFARLSSLCGKAFEGRVASPPVEADASLRAAPPQPLLPGRFRSQPAGGAAASALGWALNAGVTSF